MPYDRIYKGRDGTICINNRKIEVNEDDEDKYDRYVNDYFAAMPSCPFCGSKLVIANHSEDIKDFDYEFVYVAECANCGFWQSLISQHNYYDYDPYQWDAEISKLTEFSEVMPHGCKHELAQYLKANPTYWNAISPRNLELLVADIFKANHNTCEVIHVGQPNDGGVDVVFVDSGKNRWLIQVKRRESALASEGVATLRNLLGVLLLENVKYGMVVSTADHFTYWAQRSKEKAESLGYVIELIDRGKLQRMIEPFLPNRQWANLIADRKPEWLNIISQQMPDRRQISFDDFLSGRNRHN